MMPLNSFNYLVKTALTVLALSLSYSYPAITQPTNGLTPLTQPLAFKVFGYVKGFKEPQPLDYKDVEKLKIFSHETIPTWLALVSDLDTNSPKLHIIDTEHFKSFPTQYGIHQAYAQQMGIVSGPQDFIAQLKADGRPRKIMPFTFYIPNSSLSKGSGSAQWVLQNRRYIFKDNAKSFVASLIKSADAFEQNLGGLVSGRPFFITYDKANSTRRPNLATAEGQADIRELENNAAQVVTEREMATLAGEAPPLVNIHNGIVNNEAFGYIKVIQTEDEMQDLTPQHIAIFHSLPDRIPPVAAIVTLEDQPELSHINVLAINRGTFNVAISQEASGIIPTLLNQSNQLKDRPTQLKVVGESVQLTLATEKQVADFQKQLKEKLGPAVEIPTIVLDGKISARKATVSDSPSTVGAKAANYGEVERLLGSQYVKEGFAIPFDLYQHVVRHGGSASIEEVMIKPLLEKVSQGSLTPREINQKLQEIQLAIQSAELPSSILTSLKELADGPYKDIPGSGKIRFRSSTNCEDLPRFNGAGLYHSEGIKIKHLRKAQTSAKSLAKLHESLLLVVSSLWLPRAFWERDYFSIDHMKAGLAVQINPSFSDEGANGVVVANLNDAGKMEYWVNTQFGEASVTNPGRGEIPESIKVSLVGDGLPSLLSELPNAPLSIQSRSNIQEIFLDQNNQLKPTLQRQLAELLNTSQIVFQELIKDSEDYGIDIEFKLMYENGEMKLYLKQARPINLTLRH